MVFVSFCFLAPVHGMEKSSVGNEDKKAVLEFVEKKASIYRCYCHLVDLAKKNKKKVGDKIYWTVVKFGKFAGNSLGGGGFRGTIYGLVGGTLGLVGGVL